MNAPTERHATPGAAPRPTLAFFEAQVARTPTDTLRGVVDRVETPPRALPAELVTQGTYFALPDLCGWPELRPGEAARRLALRALAARRAALTALPGGGGSPAPAAPCAALLRKALDEDIGAWALRAPGVVPEALAIVTGAADLDAIADDADPDVVVRLLEGYPGPLETIPAQIRAAAWRALATLRLSHGTLANARRRAAARAIFRSPEGAA